MDQEFKARAGSRQEAYASIVNQVRAYLRRTSRANHYWEIQRTEWRPTELFGGGELKAHVWIKDSKMTENSLMKFIDSCVGNIARKIEDEFKESDHPRDKGSKFTSKGGESRGEGGLHHAGKDVEELGEELDKRHESVIEKQKSRRGKSEIEGEASSSSKSAKKVDPKASKHIHKVLEDEIRQIAENSADKEEFKINLGAFLEDYVQDDYADTDERAMENFGYDKETVHAVAEEMKSEIDSIADDIFEEEDDDTSVTGPEDRDHMNE